MIVSIITVVKNDVKNILKTLNSVINQNYSKIEYIIIDGNSNDGTYEKIRHKLKKIKKNNIKLFKKKDKNMYDAINYGIKVSTGEVIGLIHSGDKYYNRNVIKNVISNFKNDINTISGNIVYLKKNKITRLWDYKISVLNLFSCFKVAHTSLFIKKKLIKKIGLYNISYKICSDTDFIFKLSKEIKVKYKYLNNFLIKMPIGGMSTSNSFIFKKVLEDLKIYYENYNFFFIFFYLHKIFYKFFKLIVWKLKKSN